MYPFTRPGAGSQVTRKLDIVESEVLKFLGGLKGEAVRMEEKDLIRPAAEKTQQICFYLKMQQIQH